MVTPSWKVKPEAGEAATADHPVSRVSLTSDDARQFFAVDLSGSTLGKVLERELEFTAAMSHSYDLAVTWGSSCSAPAPPSSVSRKCMGGTKPAVILNHKGALGALLDADVWYLITDGEVDNHRVTKLCSRAIEEGLLHIPVIFLIVGHKRETPGTVDVSVGISFFANATDVLVLYKNVVNGELFILAGKGRFSPLVGDDGPDLSSWDTVKRIESEAALVELFAAHEIAVPAVPSRPKSHSGAIGLGSEWQGLEGNEGASVDMALLFRAGVLDDAELEPLLADEAFEQLSIACKTRDKLHDLRTFLLRQKVETVPIRLDDVSGATAIVAQLGNDSVDGEARQILQAQLREAHASNLRRYQEARDDPRRSADMEAARRRNRLVSGALEELAVLERAGYTGDIMARRSNRARRAETVAVDDVSTAALDLDLADPTAFRGECRICYRDDEIMSLAIKEGADGGANTADFALDFPLAAGRSGGNRDLICSQGVVCFQCALALDGRSIYHEPLAAVLPTVEYKGNNKKYIEQQLFLALTGGLRTGTSVVSQLFMTILDRTLREVPWARDVDESDSQGRQRRAMLEWTLDGLLNNTVSRENFGPEGAWVEYPKALAWAARDFQDRGIDSWPIGYPVAGFCQLVSFGRRCGGFDEQAARRMSVVKLLHLIPSTFFALMIKQEVGEEGGAWRQPLLGMIYSRFHTDLVPVDTKSDGGGDGESFITSPDVFWSRLEVFLGNDCARFLTGWDQRDKESAMPRVQLVAFWLAYKHIGHSRAKTFFASMRETQTLGLAVTDPSADFSAAVVRPVLTSIFVPASGRDQAVVAKHAGLHPFATPFGPSVLRCCDASCAEPFVDPAAVPAPGEPWSVKFTDGLRKARAAHLVRVYGADATFGAKSQTGLPVPTATPEAPTSFHANVHSSMALTWSQLDKDQRRRVAEGDPAAMDSYVGLAITALCRGGRGNIFNEKHDSCIRGLVPSLLEALSRALRVGGKADAGAWEYEYDWDQRSVDAKGKLEVVMEREGR